MLLNQAQRYIIFSNTSKNREKYFQIQTNFERKTEQIQTNKVKSWVKQWISAKYRQNIDKKGHKNAA